MSLQLPPTDFLKHHLDPLSHHIDESGGAHVLLGIIAANGEPHIYVVGNMHGNLRKEAYDALGDLLKRRASETNKDAITAGAGGSTLIV